MEKNEIAITLEARKMIIEGAKKSWQYEDVVITDNAEITFGTNGAWVSARVWVPTEDYQDKIETKIKIEAKKSA